MVLVILREGFRAVVVVLVVITVTVGRKPPTIR